MLAILHRALKLWLKLPIQIFAKQFFFRRSPPAATSIPALWPMGNLIYHIEKTCMLLIVYGSMIGEIMGVSTYFQRSVERPIINLTRDLRPSEHGHQLRNSDSFSIFKCNTDRFKRRYFPAFTQHFSNSVDNGQYVIFYGNNSNVICICLLF